MSNTKIIKHGVPVRFGKANAAPESPENGMIYYDTATDLFKVYESGSWQVLSSRNYADANVAGFDIKESCRVASVDDISAVYANGSSGVGATLTGAGALGTIDGVSVSLNERVLVLSQSDATQNGIYKLTALNPFVLTRTADFDDSTEVTGGEFIFIKDGTVFGNCAFVCTNSGPATIGSSNISFTQISGTARTLQQYYATGNQITTGAGLDVVIAGSEKLEVSAAGGMEISNDLSAGDSLLSSGSVTEGMSVAVGKFRISTGGNITRLNDVVTSFPTSASMANYALANNGSGTLSFANLALSNLNDAVLSSPSSGQFLKYDSASGSWLNDTAAASLESDELIQTDSSGLLDTSFLQTPGIDIGGNIISGVAAPSVSSDVANKAYRDGVTLQDLYSQDEDGSGASISTSATDGDLIIAGTEKLLVSAASGVDVSQILMVSGSMAAGSLVVASGSMSVSALGDIGKIRGVSYSFPASQASGSNFALVNDGAGGLTWGTLQAAELNDVALSSVSDDQILRFDGTDFVNVSLVTSGGSGDIIKSMSVSGKLDTELLKYSVNFGDNRLSNVQEPVASGDMATKIYTDGAIIDSGSGTGALTLQKLYDYGVGSDALVSTSSLDGALVFDGTEAFKLSAAKGFLLADNADASKVSKSLYKHGLSLSASQNATALAALTFDPSLYQGCLVEYKIKDSAGATRVGMLMISSNGTNTSVSDSFVETAPLGVSWSVGLGDGTVEVRYTTDASSKLMDAKIKLFD